MRKSAEVATFVLIALAVLAGPAAGAPQTKADKAKVKSLLTANGGEWTVEWWYTKEGDKKTWSYKTRFVTQRGKFGSDITGHHKGSCFKEAQLKPKGFTYTDCSGNEAEIQYDPSDAKYPFKGDASYTSMRFTQSP
jgi:hypothetical protein